MADRYIDTAYVDAAMGQSVREGLLGESDLGDLDVIIEAATALVQGYLRNSGYTVLSTVDPTEVDPLVKLAVMALVWQMLASRPDNSLELPATWATSVYSLALGGILSGDVTLSLALTARDAVGGWSFTSRTARPAYTTREELEGWG